MDAISILAALNEHYLPQLHVLLTSLRLNNPGEHIDLYLLQSAVSPEGLAGVERQCAAFGYQFFPVRVDDTLWNYDARNYNNYRLRSAGAHDLPWMMEHTAILHFCGKAKPWKPGYVYRFGVLYHHYAQLTRRACQACRA